MVVDDHIVIRVHSYGCSKGSSLWHKSYFFTTPYPSNSLSQEELLLHQRRMASTLHLLAIVAVLSVVLANAANVVQFDAYRSKPVLKWTVNDVEAWMNNTLGYPEYSILVRKHVVDGPTLLALQYDDLVESFALAHPLHLVKLRAHLTILKSQCLCEVKTYDFWSLLKAKHDKVYVSGSAAIFTPRVAMLYSYFFDYRTVEEILAPNMVKEDDLTIFSERIVPTATSVASTAAEDGVAPTEGEGAAPLLPATLGVSTFSTIVYLVSALLFPRLWMMYQVGGLFYSNYLVVLALWATLLSGQIGEVVTFFIIYDDVFHRKDVPAGFIAFYRRYWNQWYLVVPLATFTTSWFLPYMLQDLAIYAFFVFAAFSVLGLGQIALEFVRGFFQGARGPEPGSADSTQHQKAD